MERLVLFSIVVVVVVFEFEEAIGFCCGDVEADKDGLTAMGVMAQLAQSVYA